MVREEGPSRWCARRSRKGRVGTGLPAWRALVAIAVWASGLYGTVPAAAQTTEKVLPLSAGRTGVAPLGRDVGARDAINASRLEVLRERAQQRVESTAMVRDRLGPHGMSQKGLARRDARLRGLLRSNGLAQPETLSVLLIRIAFETDRSGDLTSVTTDGDFDYSEVPVDTVIFDPPPHDKAYFESHMRGLAEYWGSMSNGLIRVESQVLPPGDRDAYYLSDIADYGPGAGGFWTIEALERLVQDMIRAADEGTRADGSANLADYDFDDPNTYIIFAHAGADLQSNLVFTEGIAGYSPNDIPTFFVSLGDSARVRLDSIDPDSGAQGLITECSVIPETTNQDGLSGSISAALMHEFGHALGLPDLYSTSTGLPTIGYWGIMDSGTNLAAAVGIDRDDDGQADRVEIVTGLLPPAASAWTRWFLGFTEEIRVGSREVTVDLPASYRQDTRRKVLRMDVSPEEFFLIENRWIPPVAEGAWALARDPGTNVVLFLGDFRTGTPVNTHLYDFFMPFAGGLQVWRVRQDRAEAFGFSNTVQADRERLGIELIEADGIQDIGVFDFNTRGFIGSDGDSFRDLSTYVYVDTDASGGVGTGTITFPKTSTELEPEGTPNSYSTFRVPTGVRLRDIGPSRRDATRVSARIEGLVDPGHGQGWPVELPDAVDGDGGERVVRGDAPSVSTVDLGGTPTLLVAAIVADSTSAPGLYAYDLGGSPRYAQARAIDLAGPPAGPLAVFTNAGERIASVSTGGAVEIFADGGSALGRVSLTALGTAIDVGPVVVSTPSGPWIVAGHTVDGRVGVVDATGQVVGAATGPQAIGPGAEGQALRSNPVGLVRGGVVSLAAIGSEGLWTWSPDGGRVMVDLGRGFEDRGHLAVWPATDDDERLVFVDASGAVLALQIDGMGAWTVRDFGDPLDASPIGPPALGDVDGDGNVDLVMATEYVVYARHASGTDLLGFPKLLSDHYVPTDPFPDEVTGGPLVADVDGDGRNEVVFVSSYGLVQAIDSEGGPTRGFPKRVAGGFATPLIHDVRIGDGSRRALALFDALGDSLVSGRRERPARLNLVDLGPSPTGDDRPAEWLMRGGDPQRSARGRLGGSSAALAAIGDAAPVVYPNPIRATTGSAARVQFYAGRAHTGRLTVYNLEGQEVLNLTKRIEGAGTDFIEFSADGLQSGAYICRLDYEDVRGRTTEVLTVYVER